MALRRNIDRRGRLARLLVGLLLGAAAAWRGATASGGWEVAGAVALAAASALVLLEAAAGWCAARACGLRTPF